MKLLIIYLYVPLKKNVKFVYVTVTLIATEISFSYLKNDLSLSCNIQKFSMVFKIYLQMWQHQSEQKCFTTN